MPVTTALDELRDCNLLDGEIPSATGGMTRRDLAFRTAKAGVAAASVPMIISIAAPTPAAAATPSPRQCLLYTDEDCFNCSRICGCCCCGQQGGGGTQPSCKLCYTVSGCSTFSLAGGAVLDLNCSVGDPPHPQCGPPADEYECKSGQIVTLDSNTRCCSFINAPPTSTTT